MRLKKRIFVINRDFIIITGRDIIRGITKTVFIFIIAILISVFSDRLLIPSLAASCVKGSNTTPKLASEPYLPVVL
jgi:hypothetical protein